jgi:hypothetical protein
LQNNRQFFNKHHNASSTGLAVINHHYQAVIRQPGPLAIKNRTALPVAISEKPAGIQTGLKLNP